jgi:hypothetical protein
LRSAEGDVIFIAFPTTEVQKWAFDLIEW